MNDKLVKTGHRKGYYKAKSVFVGFLFVLAVFAASATPIAITYAASAKAGGADAHEETTSQVSEEEPEESDSLSE